MPLLTDECHGYDLDGNPVEPIVSVRDAINAGRYENKVPFTLPPLDIDEANTTIQRARELREEYKAKRHAQRILHSQEGARLRALFKADLGAENGLTGHLKSDQLFRLAWEHGHSSGYFEIVSYYEDFAELLTPVELETERA